MERIEIPVDLEPVVQSYYENDAKLLYGMVDRILWKLHVTDADKSDFYSLANEVFMYVIRDYDSSKSFDGFLYSCLYKKCCTEMSRRNCEKRKADRMSVSIDTPVCDDGDSVSTIGDMIADANTVEKILFEDHKDGYSGKVLTYLGRLSLLQKEVLRLSIAGYLPGEIREELHINERQYADCYAAIHSYRNVSVLF